MCIVIYISKVYILTLTLYNHNFDTKISTNGEKWTNCGDTKI